MDPERASWVPGGKGSREPLPPEEWTLRLGLLLIEKVGEGNAYLSKPSGLWDSLTLGEGRVGVDRASGRLGLS